MARYNKYDDGRGAQIAGDIQWRGVNARSHPSSVPAGFCSDAINCRFNRGIVEPRLGRVYPPWCNKIVGGKVQPWGVVYGIGEFSDPFTGHAYMIIAADGNVYYSRADNAPIQIPLPAGVSITSPVTFTQAFDVLVMHRGKGLETLNLLRIQTAWTGVNFTPDGTGTLPIPQADFSVFVQNRLFIPQIESDSIAASDVDDYTRYVPVLESFRVNSGSADTMVAIAKFSDTALVVFKTNSIYTLQNVFGDLSSVLQDQVSDQVGLVARQSVKQVGEDLWYLSQMGVMSLQQDLQNKVRGQVLPVSAELQPVIDRIAWKYASGAIAEYWQNRYYLAVPLDAAEVTSRELVTGELPNTFGGLSVSLVVGATYRFAGGPDACTIQVGSDTFGDEDFVASAATGSIVSGDLATAPVRCSLKRVTKGVNNAILVYDFLNGAWSGYDQAAGFDVKFMLTFPYQDRSRLFVVQSDGFICMYEEAFEDQLSEPYSTLTVTSKPSVGNTVQVNGGTLVTVTASTTDTLTQWGCSSLAVAEANIYHNPGLSPPYGFNQHAGGATFWSAPNTLPKAGSQSGEVVFYSTTGFVPVIAITGSWSRLVETATAAIETSLTTRGYPFPGADIGRFTWAELDLEGWAPNYSISIFTPGVEETEALVVDQERNRVKYFSPFNAADFVPDNSNGDFLTPRREDYSVNLQDSGIYLQEGIPVDRFQQYRHSRRCTVHGPYCQIQLTNSAGRLRLTGTRVEMNADNARQQILT